MSVKKPLLTAVFVCMACYFPAGAIHASNYIGLDGSSVSIDHLDEKNINPLGLRLRFGTRLSEGLDLEAHFGGGADSSTRMFEEISTTYMGFYLKGYLPLGYRSALFALVGGSNVELTQTIRGGKFSDDRSGLSYGFGLETQLSERLDLSADYMRYALDDDAFAGVSAVNLGLKLYF